MNSEAARIALDKKLQSLPSASQLARPHKGWIRAVREALGMSSAQFATRLGVSRPRISALEKSEVEETVTLATLRRAAGSLDCSLVYAFVPRKSLQDTVEARARQMAAQLIGNVDHTMALEDQSLGKETVAEEIETLAQELIRTKERILWNDRS